MKDFNKKLMLTVFIFFCYTIVSLTLYSQNNIITVNKAVVYQSKLLESNTMSEVSVTIGEDVNYYNSLEEALAIAPDNEEIIITILKNIELNSDIKIPANKNIVIDGGNKYSLIRGKKSDGSWYTGRLFQVAADGKLIFRNLTLELNHEWQFDQEAYDVALEKQERVSDANAFVKALDIAPVATDWVVNVSGTVIVDNCTIKNHYSKNKGLFTTAAGSSVTLIDTKIIHCASLDGGLVAYTNGNNSNFYVEKGTTIDGNYAGGNGGIFKIYGNSNVIINGGEITNTTARNSNGVVAMMYGCTSKLTVNDGVISNNTGINGVSNGRASTIYLHNCGAFVMNGGVIENNIGNSRGAIDSSRANNIIELNGGIIQNNRVSSEVYENRSDVGITYDLNLTIENDMIINGNIYVPGSVTNNGIINGTLSVDMSASTETSAINGTGEINGDVVIYYAGDVAPEFTIDSTIKGNKIYANKDKEVIVNLYYNGGYDHKKNSEKIMSVTIGSNIILPSLEKEGYTFKGWYTDEELTKIYTPSPVNKTLKLYAAWQINQYKVTWDVDGVTESKILTYGDNLVMPEVPNKEGYIFEGWTNYIDGMSVPANDITFVAEYYSIENPTTGDDILITITMFFISFSMLTILIMYNLKQSIHPPHWKKLIK